ncbi:hypothetical protein [Brevundimonas pondensis]|uniref:Amino acid permease n=1 Tax=Brevundimonas pondensis TaxID=2774189 RepID=A0ABX7SJP2_9CAUL|nr:hypothetical protein [Brevundimonas pondensis]QTC87912.1 hypothetical protein IFE19_00410 [Brevundimonas pondensis]
MIWWALCKLFGFRPISRDSARDWAAILYTPVLTICAVALTWIIVWGGWPAETASQRLNFLGWTLMGLLALIALGTFFLQRRTVNIKAETPAGSVEIEEAR